MKIPTLSAGFISLAPVRSGSGGPGTVVLNVDKLASAVNLEASHGGFGPPGLILESPDISLTASYPAIKTVAYHLV